MLPEDGAAAAALPEPAPADDAAGPLPIALPVLLESLLFVAPAPTPIERLVEVCGQDAAAVEAALAELADTLSSAGRGLRLLRKGDRVHLTTSPEAAAHVEHFLGLDLSTKLSTAALETLAVIAYQQPITRGSIEAIRGVSCEAVLHTLLARELVEPVGRLDQPGRPYLYGTTTGFLQYLGLENLKGLPPLPEAEPGG